MFSVTASGVLTPIGGSPPDQSATAVAFSPSGALLAAANTTSDTISMFSVASSGALTSVSDSPFTLSAEPTSVVFSPSGGLLAVTAGKEESQSLYMFSVTASGAMTAVPGSPYSVSSSEHLAFSPTGGLLAVQVKNGVKMFSVSSTGALTEVPGSPFVSKSSNPKGIAFRPNGNLLTSALGEQMGEGETITTYSVASSGALTLLGSGAGSKDPQGGQSSAFSPDGSTVVAPVMDSSFFQVFSVSESGAVTSLTSRPFTTGPHSHAAFSAGGMLALSGPSVWVPSSTSASTNWVGALGSEGYDLAGWNGESDLSDLPASVSLVKGTRCTWAANTSNVFALTSPDGLTRTAAGYCNPEKQGAATRLGEAQVKLTFSKAYTGNLRVYSVLWEGAQSLEGKPRESISVGGASAALEDNPDQGNGSFTAGGWALFPISEPAGGSLTISGAVLSGIFLGDAPPAVPVSSSPQGTWSGAVGSAGYDLAAWDGESDVSDLPNASLSLTQGSRYQWASHTEDPRALQSPGGLTREAATYYDPNQIRLSLKFNSAYTGNLHLYALDWDSTARRELISVDGQTAELSSSFNQGAWMSFPISVAAGETVSIVVARTAGANAVLSGVFLGEGGSPPAATTSTSPKGAWAGAVGSAGYDLAAWDGESDAADLPNASLSLTQGSRYQWASSSEDPRALQSPDGLTREAATYYDPNQIRLSLKFNSAYSGNLHLYALDWDSTSRRELVSVNGRTAALSSSFNEGAWMSFPISVAAGETVSIIVDRTAGANAVLSGIFLGEAGPPPVTESPSAVQGNWVGSYGSAGYDLSAWSGASDLVSIPSAAVSLAQGSRYVWASSTSDVRALESPEKTTREAATYYDPNQIRLSLKFNTAYSGNLHLYALDWDSTARRELISVDGQTAALSSSFNQGAWVSFPISVAAGETVSIVVDRTAGANAVLSGVFLGAGPAAQKALMPLYDNANPADWTAACSQTASGSLLIADVAEGQGPGSASVPAWANVIDNCSSYGRASVIGYVWTDYGEGGQASIAGIESQINAWYSYYPGHIAGIFFDGVSDDVPGTSTSNLGFYQALASYVHTHEGSSSEVVFNFGANPGSDWMLSNREANNNANLVVTFEGSYNTAAEDPYTSWTQAAWEAAYPADDFAALLYNAPDGAVTPQPTSACSSLARQNIGYTYVGTWYDELPAYFGNFLTDSASGEC
jgi:6-phosphogluconolactonase (cycloisomerase 2 family)